MPIQIRSSHDYQAPYFDECDRLTISIPPENIDPHLRDALIAAELVKASNPMHDRKSKESWDDVFQAFVPKDERKQKGSPPRDI